MKIAKNLSTFSVKNKCEKVNNKDQIKFID